jgi:ribosomal protein S3
MTVQVPQEVADAVAEALANALENGHDFKGWTDEQVADDMMAYDADVENMPRDQVVAAVNGLRS